jgi:glutamine synthetase
MPEKRAKNLELLIADANGIPRGKTIDSAALDESDPPHIAAAIFCQCVHGDYAHHAMELYNPRDEDLLLQPDWSTYRSTPWKENTELGEEFGQVICDTLDKNGTPIPYDPRNVLKRILSIYSERGLTPIIAPEVEFYLLNPVQEGQQRLLPAAGQDRRVESGGEAFSIDALDKYAAFTQSLQQMCKQAELNMSAVVHEMGPGQIELNISYGEALGRADELFILKRLVKACALKHGHNASFMAKPMAGLPGSGLHLHCSVLDAQGENIFSTENGKAPESLQRFIAGLQKYLPEAFVLIAPNANSYKRFVPDLSAPINLEWGYDNRTTGLRVPYGPATGGRVENRVAGADANPYLIVAATLACGLLGIDEQLTATKPVDTDAYELEAALPEDLGQAVRKLKTSKPLIELLSQEFVDVYTSVKIEELQHYNKQISAWEVSFLGSLV